MTPQDAGTAGSMGGEIRRVATQSATYAVGVLAGGLGRVFLIPIVARFLSADEYGVVALVLAFVSLAGIIMDLGLASSLVKFFSEAPDAPRRRRITSTLLASGVASALLVGLLFLPAARLVSSLLFRRPDYTGFVYLGLGLALATTLLRLAMSYYQALPAPRRFTAVSVLKGSLAIAGAALFVIHLRGGARGFLLGTLLPPAILAAVVLPAILRSVGGAWDGHELRRGLRFGMPLVPSTFALWGLTYCDVYLLGRLATLEQVGWYQMGQEICLGLGLVTASVQLAWPRFIFSHAKEPDAPRVFSLCTDYYAAVMAAVGLGLSVFAGEILGVVGSPAFRPAATVLPVLCLTTFLFALYGVFSSGVQIRGRTEFMALTTAGGLVANVLLNLVAIPRWGMIGAASASALSNLVMCGVILAVSDRHYRIPFSPLRLTGMAGLAVGLFALSVAARRLPGMGWVLLAKAGIVAALPLAVLFGFFSPEERAGVVTLARELFRARL